TNMKQRLLKIDNGVQWLIRSFPIMQQNGKIHRSVLQSLIADMLGAGADGGIYIAVANGHWHKIGNC
ncbi:MAG: hypothetical protein DRN17_08360, partial [Thermoplasmata archaeon]